MKENAPKAFFDVKGLSMHSYFRCADKDSTLFDEKGEKRIPRATAAMETFIESYVLPTLEQSAPKDIIAVWEGGNGRRKALFPDYKVGRPEIDKNAREQIDQLYKLIKMLLASLGCVQVKYPEVEGDDAVAYLCRYVEPYSVIYTVDHDLLQLANEKTLVMISGANGSSEPMADSHGIPPHLIALHKSLLGDKSDTYPGVVQFGPKAWDELVELFGWDGLEELDKIAQARDTNALEEAAKHGGSKALQKVFEQKWHWLVQYELARLHPEWCEESFRKKLTRPEWYKRLPDRDRLIHVLQQAGCMDLLDQFEPFLPQTILVTADNVDAVLYDGPFLDDLNAGMVAFDVETYDANEFENFKEATKRQKGGFVDALSARLTGASFTFGPNLNKTVYICVNHRDTANVSKAVIADMLEACEPERLIVQNAEFEQTVIRSEFGQEFMDQILYAPIDTKILSNYVDENEPSGLKANSLQFLNYKQVSYSEVIGDRHDMRDLSGEEVLQYGADDALCTAHLFSLWHLILVAEQTWDFCYENEFLTNRVFTRSFQHGGRIDLDRLRSLREADQATLDEAWPRLRSLLAEHCTEVNEEATQRYLAEVRSFEVARLQEAGKSEEDISKKLASMTEDFRQGTVYREFQQHEIEYDFKPTITQLNSALARLGVPTESPLEDGGENPFVLRSVAVSRITEWAIDCTETHRKLADTFWSEDLERFIGLVSAAAHQFKVRKGEEYEALRDFMIELFPDKAKSVAEGDELNLGSPKQKAQLLYGKLALPIRNYSKVQEGSTREELGFAGGPSTDDKTIEIALAEDCPEGDWRREVLGLLRTITSLTTKFQNYYNPYPLWVRPDDGRIHFGLQNCGTVTRRPTASNPNILQVAKGLTRSIFQPMEADHILVAPDFSGQELRILGSEANDPVIIDAYTGEDRKDIHGLTASAILPNIAAKNRKDIFPQIKFIPGKRAQDYDQYVEWRFGEDKVLAEFAEWVRQKRAKETNFLIAYEGGAGTLSTRLLVPRDEAAEFLESMFDLYPNIKPFQEESHDLARKWGYVKTAYGNRRHMTKEILSRDDGERMRMERQASNFRIQGCAADILKLVVAEAERSGLLPETRSYILAPVYDEVVCSVPIPAVVRFCQELQAIMDILPPGHTIPMLSEFKLGFDWYNLVEIGTDTSEERILQAIEQAREKQVPTEGEAA